MPGAHIPSDGHTRARQVIDRIVGLSEAEAATTLTSTMAQFAQRHPDLERSLMRNYQAAAGLIDDPCRLTRDRRLLIGAYFTHEYAIEAAALSNPSIVQPRQTRAGWARESSASS